MLTNLLVRKILREGNRPSSEINSLNYYLADVSELESFLKNPILRPDTYISSIHPDRGELPKWYCRIVFNSQLYLMHVESFEKLENPNDFKDIRVKNPINILKYIDFVDVNIHSRDAKSQSVIDNLSEVFENIDFRK